MGKKGKKGKGKSGKKGKKGKKRSANDPPSVSDIILKKLLKYYEQYSNELNVKCCPDVVKSIKESLQEEKHFNTILVRPIDVDAKVEAKFQKALLAAQKENDVKTIAELKSNYNNTPPEVLLQPLMKALNQVQFNWCKELYILDLPMYYDDAVELTNFVKANPIRKIEISDCLIQFDSLRKFSSIGDKGCNTLCNGLIGNCFLLILSLNYCKLTQKSGEYLGEILSTTALAELYLDGNDLGCQGVISLVGKIAEECESEAIRKLQEEKEKQEAEAKRLAEEDAKPEWEKAMLRQQQLPQSDATDTENKEKKEKKKKKKKKKKIVEPPPVGPFVRKLHLADNGIDIYENGADRLKSYNILHQTIDVFIKLIKYSKDLEELDLHNNTMGNMSARLILNALEYRKSYKVGNLGVRVSEKIDKDLFDAILKASKKIKKKRGKKKKVKSKILNDTKNGQ